MPKEVGRQQVEALRKKLLEDPRSLAFVELAEGLCGMGEYQEASEVAQRGLLSHPDSVAGRLVLAVAEAEQDHIREALEQIKRALLIDQENPRALALMGRILLKKNLARRAVQFLSHAVKLAPDEKEYADLLASARAQSKKSSGKETPVFDGSRVPNAGSPWEEDESSDIGGEAKHTVFDPGTLQKLKAKDKQKKFDDALKRLPSVDEEDPDPEEEPTKFEEKNPGVR